MQDYFETIEEKDQICKEKPKHCTAMLLIQKASSDRSLLNTLKLNLTSRRFDCDNLKKFEQILRIPLI